MPAEMPGRIRSTRNVRQSAGSRSQATKVPALAGVDDPVWLGAPLRRRLLAVGVVEPDRDSVAGEARELGEDPGSTVCAGR